VAGRKALDQHIYILDQAQQELASFRLCKVEGDAAFIGVESEE
jgi:hypothetical protein